MSNNTKAQKLARQAQDNLAELSALLAADGTVQADERMEYVRTYLRKHVLSVSQRSLYAAGGYKGGFRTPLTHVDRALKALLQELDDWETRGTVPEGLSEQQRRAAAGTDGKSAAPEDQGH